jgi:hypothetical protein
MNTQNPVRLLVADKLDHSLRIKVRLGPTVGGERESPDIVFDSSFFDFLFCLAHPRYFGMGINDAGDGTVVDMAVTRFDVLDRSNAFFFGFMGQHCSECYVADTSDVGLRCAVFGINDDAAFVVLLDANCFEIKILRIRSSTDRDEAYVRFQLNTSVLVIARV